jgi:hypothetical protein
VRRSSSIAFNTATLRSASVNSSRARASIDLPYAERSSSSRTCASSDHAWIIAAPRLRPSTTREAGSFDRCISRSVVSPAAHRLNRPECSRANGITRPSTQPIQAPRTITRSGSHAA